MNNIQQKIKREEIKKEYNIPQQIGGKKNKEYYNKYLYYKNKYLKEKKKRKN